jgi:lipase
MSERLRGRMMSAPRAQQLRQDIGDASLSYLLYDGDGPTIILLHATGFGPWLWQPIAGILSSRYRVIAPNLFDHRDQDPEQGGINWNILAEDISRFCETLQILHPFLVGHSMGATVSTIAHAEYGLNAGAMVLVEPIFLPQPFYMMGMTTDNHPLASRAMRRTNYWQNKREAADYLRSRSLFKDWDEEVVELYIDHGMKKSTKGGLELACSPRKEAALFMGGMQYNPWPVLPKVTCPVLVVEGEKSENKQFVNLEEVVSVLPNGFFRTISDGGHLVPMEQPGKVAAIIEDFISSGRYTSNE